MERAPQGKLLSMSEFKHKIAVISDTHSLLRPEIKERLMECELILHAGDKSGHNEDIRR
jgi:predicted phosphodiesterase